MTQAKQRWIVQKVTSLAQALNVSRDTIRNWRKKGMPVEEDGGFDVERIRSWSKREYSASRRRNAASRCAKGDEGDGHELNGETPELEPDDLDDLRGSELDEAAVREATRFRRAKASLAEAELRVKEGTLIERGEVERHAGQVMKALSRELMEILPRRVAPDLEGKSIIEIQDKLQDEIRATLDRMSRKAEW